MIEYHLLPVVKRCAGHLATALRWVLVACALLAVAELALLPLRLVLPGIVCGMVSAFLLQLGLCLLVVLANLPYVPDGEEVSAEVQHDPATALYGGPDGLDVVRRFLKDALPHLAAHALVMLEVGHDQGPATREIMEQLGYTQCRVLTDMSGKARFPMGFAPQLPEPEPAEQEPRADD